MLIVTVWPVSKWRDTLPLLRAARPDAVMLHSDPETLESRAPGIVNSLRAELGASMPREVWLGVAFDVAFTRVQKRIAANPGRAGAELEALATLRLRAARAANAVGAPTVILDPEAAWKRNAPGFNAAAATDTLARFRAVYSGRIGVTSYDCPGYHSAFPWRAWDGCDVWAPQVYAAPAKGAPDRASHQGRSRLKLHQTMWRDAITRGWLRDRPAIGYVQAHHVVDRETCWIANAFDEVAMWAAPTRLDADGERAAQILAALERRGFRGVDRVRAFQRSAGLVDDGLIGPATLRALGIFA